MGFIASIAGRWRTTAQLRSLKHTPSLPAAGAVIAASLFCLLLPLAVQQASAEPRFLPPEQAFQLSARWLDASRMEVRFDVADGYYLYRDKLTVSATPVGVVSGAAEVPRGEVKYDKTFEKDVETLRSAVQVVVPVTGRAEGFELQIGNQGCADEGLCYPPQLRTVQVAPGTAGQAAVTVPGQTTSRSGGLGGLLSGLMGGGSSTAGSTAIPPAPVARSASPAERGEGASTSNAAGPVAAASPAAPVGLSNAGGAASEPFGLALASRSLPRVAAVFALAGLLLAFTPCVLPMVPILSSIIVGQAGPVSRARGFALAASYSLGMALVYTAFGITAALLGEGLGAALQNPWVLSAFALLLAGLSLSMFGAYELQVPPSFQARFTQWSNKFQGGRHWGVFAMGGLSALIVGPCVAAPLAGALVYISQTRDVLLGGVALFAMALGMSVPLLLVGLSAGTLLPRAGAWMAHVKQGFGFLLLGVALWMVTPVLPAWVVMVAAAALLLATAVYLGAFEPLQRPAGHGLHAGHTFSKGAGLVLAVLAAVLLVGVASGGRSVLQPLQHLAGRGAAAGAGPELRFAPVANLAALDAAIQASTRPVMLDLYADWCVSCKEFEAFTLTDPGVQSRLAGMTLLRADVTAHNDADRALLRRYGLFGPPALLFFPPAGAEVPQARVIGFQSAAEFSGHLDRIAPLTRPQ